MPQIWLRPFMGGNVVEDGGGVKFNPRIGAPAAPVNESFTPASHCQG
jgi:hypothetical protein